jgi:hypothetical protein
MKLIAGEQLVVADELPVIVTSPLNLGGVLQ